MKMNINSQIDPFVPANAQFNSKGQLTEDHS